MGTEIGRSRGMPQMQQHNGSGPHRRYIVGLKGKWSSLKFPPTYTAIDLTGAKLWQANLTGVVGADLTKAILE